MSDPKELPDFPLMDDAPINDGHGYNRDPDDLKVFDREELDDIDDDFDNDNEWEE